MRARCSASIAAVALLGACGGGRLAAPGTDASAAPGDAALDARPVDAGVGLDGGTEAAPACTPAPVIMPYDDAGVGCLFRDASSCGVGAYRVECWGPVDVPAALQCQQGSNPTPYSEYCCPCVPSTCTQSPSDGCHQAHVATCPSTLAEAHALCPSEGGDYFAECGAFVAWKADEPGSDYEGCTFYFSSSTGEVAAIFCDTGPLTRTICIGGATDFVVPECDSFPPQCRVETDGG